MYFCLELDGDTITQMVTINLPAARQVQRDRQVQRQAGTGTDRYMSHVSMMSSDSSFTVYDSDTMASGPLLVELRHYLCPACCRCVGAVECWIPRWGGKRTEPDCGPLPPPSPPWPLCTHSVWSAGSPEPRGPSTSRTHTPASQWRTLHKGAVRSETD